MWAYSISFLVENSVEQSWTSWIKNHFENQKQENKNILNIQYSKIYHQTADPNSSNYNVLLFFNHKEILENYIEKYDDINHLKNHENFNNKVMTFITKLEILNKINNNI